MEYSISHPCGLEIHGLKKQTAMRDALKHWDDCKHLMANGQKDWVAVDEYDLDAGELSGRYWMVGRDAMLKPFRIQK